MARVTFFGLGKMGAPMAHNLAKAGHQLTVYDPFPEVCEAFRQQGAAVAPSPLAAVEEAEFVISMLPEGRHVVALYAGDEAQAGIIPQLREEALVIDCSTIDVGSVNTVFEAARQRGVAMIDAPVSGGVSAAQAGTLTFMCGGPEPHVARAKPVLAGMGKNLLRAGDSGAGQVAKMCNNMLLAIHMAGTAEALNLGINNGLDAKALSEIMRQSSGGNWSLEKYNPAPGVMANAPASHDFQPGFTVELMLKDLGLAMTNSLTTKSAVPLGALARNLYACHSRQQRDNDKLDFSSIWQMYC